MNNAQRGIFQREPFMWPTPRKVSSNSPCRNSCQGGSAPRRKDRTREWLCCWNPRRISTMRRARNRTRPNSASCCSISGLTKNSSCSFSWGCCSARYSSSYSRFSPRLSSITVSATTTSVSWWSSSSPNSPSTWHRRPWSSSARGFCSTSAPASTSPSSPTSSSS